MHILANKQTGGNNSVIVSYVRVVHEIPSVVYHITQIKIYGV